MVEFLKKKWVEWAVVLTISVIGVIITNHFTIKRESKSSIERKIEQKANTDYVNQQDNAIRSYIDTQDTNIQDVIKQHIEESQKLNKAEMELIKSIDQKMNILIIKIK